MSDCWRHEKTALKAVFNALITSTLPKAYIKGADQSAGGFPTAVASQLFPASRM